MCRPLAFSRPGGRHTDHVDVVPGACYFSDGGRPPLLLRTISTIASNRVRNWAPSVSVIGGTSISRTGTPSRVLTASAMTADSVAQWLAQEFAKSRRLPRRTCGFRGRRNRPESAAGPNHRVGQHHACQGFHGGAILRESASGHGRTDTRCRRFGRQRPPQDSSPEGPPRGSPRRFSPHPHRHVRRGPSPIRRRTLANRSSSTAIVSSGSEQK